MKNETLSFVRTVTKKGVKFKSNTGDVTIYVYDYNLFKAGLLKYKTLDGKVYQTTEWQPINKLYSEEKMITLLYKKLSKKLKTSAPVAFTGTFIPQIVNPQ